MGWSDAYSREVAELGYNTQKTYKTTCEREGLEFGFGRAGRYGAHSHRHFMDVIYCPNGIRWTDCGRRCEAALLIIPARTLVPQVDIGAFAFLKFCSDNRPLVLPDKDSGYGAPLALSAFSSAARAELSWYPQCRVDPGTISLSLADGILEVAAGNECVWSIAP